MVSLLLQGLVIPAAVVSRLPQQSIAEHQLKITLLLQLACAYSMREAVVKMNHIVVNWQGLAQLGGQRWSGTVSNFSVIQVSAPRHIS